MSDAFDLAQRQLQSIAAASEGRLEVLGTQDPGDGSLFIDISVDTSGIQGTPQGMPLRARERFVVGVPEDFPYQPPSFYTRHTRFLGYAHVYWGHYLCLYQAPETEWNPSDGMFGFVDRMELFLKDAAAGNLDPIGAPRHPPTTSHSSRKNIPTIVPRADTPTVEADTWYGLATIDRISNVRTDVSGWVDILHDEWPETPTAAAVLLAKPLSHEFPSKVGDLIRALEAHGLQRKLLILTIRCALINAPAEAPLLLIVGAPMRGLAGAESTQQHLTAWLIEKEVANTLRLVAPLSTDSDDVRTLKDDLEARYFEILEDKPVDWCPVLEDRPEIITRRDSGARASWFSGRKIVIWGCGAIGAQLAEGVARAGAASIALYDSARIKPGILVRQPYEDLDIGKYKAEVLATHLQRIRPELHVTSHVQNVLTAVLDRDDWTDGADLILDATASRSVLAKTESARKRSFHAVPLASTVLGPTAESCMLLLAARGHSGATFEVSREAKLSLLADKLGSPYIEDYFPQRPGKPFQPEPGCSEPTFVGSYADVASLSQLMLNVIPTLLQTLHPSEGAAWFCHSAGSKSMLSTLEYRFDGRVSSDDPTSSFEVRISRRAWQQMQEVVKKSAWRYGRRVETGGILLGERDEVLRIMWVDEFSAPPSDSVLTEDEFLCGVQGTMVLHTDRDRRSHGSTRYLGMWHTHPSSLPVPSSKDVAAMFALSEQVGGPLAHSLMVIVGTPYEGLSLATYAFSASELEGRIFRRTCAVTHPPTDLPQSAHYLGFRSAPHSPGQEEEGIRKKVSDKASNTRVPDGVR